MDLKEIVLPDPENVPEAIVIALDHFTILDWELKLTYPFPELIGPDGNKADFVNAIQALNMLVSFALHKYGQRPKRITLGPNIIACLFGQNVLNFSDLHTITEGKPGQYSLKIPIKRSPGLKNLSGIELCFSKDWTEARAMF